MVTLLFPVVAVGQGKPAPKVEQVAKQATGKTKPAPDKGAGPVGYGPLKIGMTKVALEAMQESDGVYLKNYLSPYEDSDAKLKEGEEKFKGVLVTNLGASPIPTTFTFEKGQLTTLDMELDEFTYRRVKAQITEKYCSGKVEEHRQEEQCVYRNGANFKVNSWFVFTKWNQKMDAAQEIATSLGEVVVDMCPTNLRYGTVGATKMWSLRIGQKPITGPTAQPNLF